MSEFDRQLAQILEAREERWGKRQFYAARFPALLSMTACIPMPLRADQAVELWFTRASSRTLEFLTERGQILELLEQDTSPDGPWLIAGALQSPRELKKLLHQPLFSMSSTQAGASSGRSVPAWTAAR